MTDVRPTRGPANGAPAAATADHPALERLVRFEERTAGPPAAPPRDAVQPRKAKLVRDAEPPRMGYQPSLDGVRAMSVIAVMLYHAGFSWMHGGFFGVEVFFVVSGFLITSLLIEERDKKAGRPNLRLFWVRRFRRLLPALATVLLVVGVWAVFWGSLEQHTQVRRDYPWAALYSFNWGSIFSGGSYWGEGSPKLFRHLWSLAVEEQWYLLWPLAFLLIARRRADDRRRGRALAALAATVMLATTVANLFSWPKRLPFFMSFDIGDWGMRPVDPNNVLYLSTITRSSGLLLGAAMAFLWRPWRAAGKANPKVAASLDRAAVGAVVVLLAMFVAGRVESDNTFLWMLPLVTLASAALVMVVVHPWAVGSRIVFGSRPMVEIGKRSYGLYLWSWPISVMTKATDGSPARFLLAMAITIPVAEACYRFVETPIRTGALSKWWKARERRDWNLVTACAGVSTLVLVGAMGAFYFNADAVFDRAKDTSVVEFDASAVGATTVPAATTLPAATSVAPGASVAAPTTLPASTQPTTPVTAATLPRHVVIVGDSTAHSLAVNLPDGIESTFTIGDGAVEGCSVYESGTARSSRDNYKRPFSGCGGWPQKWVAAAQEVQAEVALVVIGAWDVFDVDLDGQMLAFDTPANDQRFLAGVQQGIDALSAAGVKVALLEIPCMRPQDVKGQGTPALPERGDDARVAHLNDLLRQLAASNPSSTTFVTGPAQYCTDPAIASDLGYRWDGVHAYKPGAKLTFEAIAAQLLAIPVP
ncbi:MAG: acyltransferase family protein [Actinomycetota bacterium]|nr:acyltransferase family protein [Actinomycetota bacterium]